MLANHAVARRLSTARTRSSCPLRPVICGWLRGITELELSGCRRIRSSRGSVCGSRGRSSPIPRSLVTSATRRLAGGSRGSCNPGRSLSHTNQEECYCLRRFRVSSDCSPTRRRRSSASPRSRRMLEEARVEYPGLARSQGSVDSAGRLRTRRRRRAPADPPADSPPRWRDRRGRRCRRSRRTARSRREARPGPRPDRTTPGSSGQSYVRTHCRRPRGWHRRPCPCGSNDSPDSVATQILLVIPFRP